MTYEFHPIPNRDAHAVVRGFCYQVATTVHRWLELGDQDELVLECGEDIDTVVRAVDESMMPVPADHPGKQTDLSLSTESHRVLEQVRDRVRPLSLASADARAALARFHWYRLNHPGQHLLLRYTTTATLATEVAWSGSEGETAIQTWQKVRNRRFAPEEEATKLTALRNLLAQSATPAEISAELWRTFTDFLRDATESEWRALVWDVEWASGAGDIHALRAETRRLLATRFDQLSESDRENVYRRLVVHVWEVLATAGRKALSADELSVHVGSRIISDHDTARLHWFERWLSDLTSRVTRAEGEIDTIATALTQVTTALDQQHSTITSLLARTKAPPISSAPPPMRLMPPPPVPKAVGRPHCISQMEDDGPTAWLAIHGASGTGKTQLALASVSQFPSAADCAWIGCRGLTGSEAASRIQTALAELPWPTDSWSLAEQTAWLAPQKPFDGRCVVIDDLPRCEAEDDAGRLLLSVVRACRAAGWRLVTTSTTQLSDSVRRQVPTEVLREFLAPPFTEAETADLFAEYGAPPAARDSHVTALASAITGGHPVLVQALARTMANEGWPTTPSRAFVRVLQRRADGVVNDETFHQLLQTVEDEHSQQLLARLSLITGTFAREDIRALAAVPPSVSRPMARLHRVVGLWVQSDGTGRFQLSPLLRDLGPVDLSDKCQKSCHRVLAEAAVARPELSPLEFLGALLHFTLAGLPERAARLLLGVLHARWFAPEKEGVSSTTDKLFAGFWAGRRLPEEVARSTGMVLRALQIRMYEADQRMIQTLQDELDALLSARTADEDSDAHFAAIIMLRGRVTPAEAWSLRRYLRIAIDTWPAVRDLASERGQPVPANVTGMFWIAAAGAPSQSAMRGWLDHLPAIAPSLRTADRADRSVVEGAHLAALAAENLEEKLPASERDWSRADDTLASMEQVATELDLPDLWAAARAVRIRVVGDAKGDRAAATSLADDALHHAKLTPDARFEITHNTGCLWLDAGDWRAAERWLAAAASATPAANSARAVRASLWYAVVLAEHDLVGALTIARGIVSAGRALPEDESHLLTTVLAEVGLLNARAREWNAAAQCWSEAALRLASRALCDSRAQIQLRAMAHPVAYFRHVHDTGHQSSPDKAVTDWPPHLATPPRSGAILQAPNTVDEEFQPAWLVLFLESIGALAAGAGLDDNAAALDQLAAELAARYAMPGVEAAIAQGCVMDAIPSRTSLLVADDLLVRSRTIWNAWVSRGTGTDKMWTAEIATVRYGWLPLLCRLGGDASALSAALPASSASAVDLCRALSRERGASMAFWRHAGEAVVLWSEGASVQALMAHAHRPPSLTEPLSTLLRTGEYILSTVLPSVTAVDALRGQFTVLAVIEARLVRYPRLYRRALVYWLFEHWSARLRFDPALVVAGDGLQQRVRSALATLALDARGDAHGALRQFLRCLAGELGVPLEPYPLSEW